MYVPRSILMGVHAKGSEILAPLDSPQHFSVLSSRVAQLASHNPAETCLTVLPVPTSTNKGVADTAPGGSEPSSQ